MLKIRPEHPNDTAEIRALITDAFRPAPYYEGAEADIVKLLNESGDMTLSLVAEKDGEILGHVAFSPVQINGEPTEWIGLGPISVPPAHRNKGVAAALVEEGVKRIKELQAHGCVTVGSAKYFKEFGFTNLAGIHLTGAPTKNFLGIAFTDDIPSGEVLFNKAFYCTYT